MGLPPTISPDAKVEHLATLPTESYTVANGFGAGTPSPFTEGTTCAPNGDVYFIEQDSSKIMKWDVSTDTLSVFMHPSGYSNGMCFDHQGNQVWSISITENETIPYPQPLNPAVGDPAKPGTITLPKHTVLVTDYQGKLLNGPNDVWVRPDGGIYMTDPYYARNWWTPGRKQEQDMKTVYFLSPDHKTLTRVLNEFNSPNGQNGTPNGIAGTGDGKTLYVFRFGRHDARRPRQFVHERWRRATGWRDRGGHQDRQANRLYRHARRPREHVLWRQRPFDALHLRAHGLLPHQDQCEGCESGEVGSPILVRLGLEWVYIAFNGLCDHGSGY